jgi:indolepyruvate ferredoxin oxidoreductase beta subunit
MRLDIVIAGVGGQGTVLASRVLAQTALDAGFPARTSEMIGMAQREGSVQSHVRIGTEFGPVIGSGAADILLGFEPAEAQRSGNQLKNGGMLLVNSHPIHPVTVALGSSAYPLAEIRAYLDRLPARVTWVDGFELALASGNFKTLNAVMLGVLASSGALPFGRDAVLRVLLEMLPERVRAVNERAFALGCQVVKEG